MKTFLLLLAAAVISVAAAVAASASTAVSVPPGVKFKTTAPAHTQNQNLLGDGWTDPHSNTDVRQNMVGCQGVPSPCGAQTLWAYSSNHWGVISDMPRGNQSVLSYPDTQLPMTLDGGAPTPLSRFKAIQGHYAVSVPPKGDYEVAYDMWLDNWNTEIMIWLYNHGQTPAGNPVGKVRYYGQTWTVWTSPGGPYTLTPDRNRTGGTVHILSALHALRVLNVIKASQWSISDIELGEEICSTGGVPEAFTFTQDHVFLHETR